jgi:uncharacterized protein (TIGR03067 family)
MAESELEGTWVSLDATVSSEVSPQIVGQRLTFRGNRFQIEKGGEVLYGGNFSLDPAAEQPTIDLDQSETGRFTGVWLGIYRLVGDQLAICDNAADMTKPRPKGFREAAGAGYVFVQFTRQVQ